MLIVAATGHGPPKLGGYGAEVNKRLVALAHDYLIDKDPDRAISGVALGWDQAFAEACVRLGIPLTAAVPFRGQEDAWPEDAQIRYDGLLTKAAFVEYVCEPGYAAWKMQKRNEWMVEHCDRLCALWDDSPGGTANCINYAEGKLMGAPVIDNLWSRRSSEKGKIKTFAPAPGVAYNRGIAGAVGGGSVRAKPKQAKP